MSTGIFDWITSMFSGKVTLANVFQLLTKVSEMVTGFDKRLGSIEARLNALELDHVVSKVKDDIS